jgi:4-amino-4-deoxy-L-arabinose transferase-like glycosyltransferase
MWLKESDLHAPMPLPLLQKSDRGQSNDRLDYSALVILLLLWLGFQAWMLKAHWINVDEGAHLMDTRLAMQGLRPVLDYDSRQPLYVYALLPFLLYSDHSYVAARMMPVIATGLASILVFLIGRRLWNSTAGLYSATAMLWTPTMLVNSSAIKTEPLAILLMCLSFYALVRHFDRGRPAWLLLAGVALGCGFYVRESTLAGPLAAIVLIGLRWRDGSGKCVRRVLYLVAGYFAVCVAMISWAAGHLSLRTTLSNTSLNPGAMVAQALCSIASLQSLTAPNLRASTETSFQPKSHALRQVLQAASLQLPLLVAALVTPAFAFSRSFQSRHFANVSISDRFAVTIPLVWSGALILLYIYHFWNHGFFQSYFREFIPPLALLFGAAASSLLRQIGQLHRSRSLLFTLLTCAATLFLYQRQNQGYGITIAILFVGTTSAILLRRHLAWTHWLIHVAGFGILLAVVRTIDASTPIGIVLTSAGSMLAAIALTASATRVSRFIPTLTTVTMAAMAFTGILSTSNAGMILSTQYDSMWSPQTLQSVVALIHQHSKDRDEVLSGAVIWEGEAGRQPFMRITHPLALHAITDPLREQITDELKARPPVVIILDGYTERYYIKNVPYLQRLLNDDYHFVGEALGSPKPVRVYARIAQRKGKVDISARPGPTSPNSSQ